MDDRLQHVRHSLACLGGDEERVRGIKPDHVLDLLAHPAGLGGRQVDLVEDRNDLVIVVDRLIDIGKRLCLHPLTGIDDEERTLAGGKRARYLVGKIDMARRIDEIQDIGLAVSRCVIEAHGIGLDGDAAFAFELHRIEDLVDHLALWYGSAELDQAVGKGRFSMIDMGDYREISNMGRIGHRGVFGIRVEGGQGEAGPWFGTILTCSPFPSPLSGARRESFLRLDRTGDPGPRDLERGR